jgi:plastocyanin
LRLDYQGPPKLTLGVVGIVAAIIPILLGYFLVSGMATSSAYSCDFSCSTTTTTTASSGPSSVVPISIPNGAGNPSNPPGYAPDVVTVVIGVNNTVVWSNDDTAAHTVTSDNNTGGAPVFDSGNMNGGQAYNYTFTTPGTYPYHCSYHSWMSGTIVVKAGVAAAKVSIPSGASNPANPPGYVPDSITVVIGLNNTVTWSNDDSAPHTVTSNSVPSGASSFDSGNMNPGQSFTFTFTVPGTYEYHCSYHSWMTGTVTVVQG